MAKPVTVEAVSVRKLRPGDICWANGDWRIFRGRGKDWEHEESGVKGPTLEWDLGSMSLAETYSFQSRVLRCVRPR